MMLKIALRAIQGTDITMAGPGCKKDGLSQRRCWQVLSHHSPKSLFDFCVVPFAHVHYQEPFYQAGGWVDPILPSSS